MINIMYVLVLLVNGSGSTSAMTTVHEPFTTEDACKAAGEGWKIATYRKENQPRYYCLPIEGRLE